MREAKGKRENDLLKDAYRRWNMSTDRKLSDVYVRASTAKYIAMDCCKTLMNELGGRDLRIISHNSQMFTVGFEFPDAETGELCFAFITKTYDRYIKL